MSKTRLIEQAPPRAAATHRPTSERATAVPRSAGQLPTGGQEARQLFERQRLAAFARRGFAGEGRRILDRGGRATYALAGEDGSHPVVLVHGGVGNTVEWAEIAPLLGGTVVIPDRPGFGLSDSRNYRGVDFRADAARWLLELADGLGEDRIDVVGNSMGGFFAIAFAAAHPERIRRLVLSGSPAGLFRSLGLFLHLWASPGIGALISRIKLGDTETLRKRAFGPYLARPERLPADLLEVALAGVNLPGTADTNRAILQNVLTLRGWRPEMRLDDALAAVKTPVLFVWGAMDRVAPVGIARDIAARMSDAKLAVIADAGHIPHIDQPEAVAAAINGFLHEPPTAGPA